MPWRPDPLRRFALGVLLFLPAALLLWWFAARPYLIQALEPVVAAALQLLWPDRVAGLAAAGNTWQVRTILPILGRPLEAAGIGLDPGRFTVAFPLFWGLVLATPGVPRLRQLLAGTVLAVYPLVVVMGVLFFQFRLALVINHQPALTEQPPGFYVLALPYPAWQYHLIGVGRQLALLVLPTLGPLLVWGALNRRFLRVVVLEGVLARAAPGART